MKTNEMPQTPLRLLPEHHELLRRTAERRGVSMGVYVRDALLPILAKDAGVRIDASAYEDPVADTLTAMRQDANLMREAATLLAAHRGALANGSVQELFTPKAPAPAPGRARPKRGPRKQA